MSAHAPKYVKANYNRGAFVRGGFCPGGFGPGGLLYGGAYVWGAFVHPPTIARCTHLYNFNGPLRPYCIFIITWIALILQKNYTNDCNHLFKRLIKLYHKLHDNSIILEVDKTTTHVLCMVINGRRTCPPLDISPHG